MKATLAAIKDARSDTTNWQGAPIYTGSDTMAGTSNSGLDGNTKKFASEDSTVLDDADSASNLREPKPFYWNSLSGDTGTRSATHDRIQRPGVNYFSNQSASGNFSTSSSENDELSSRESDISDDPSESQYHTSHVHQSNEASEINRIPRSFCDAAESSLSNATLPASPVDKSPFPRSLESSFGGNRSLPRVDTARAAKIEMEKNPDVIEGPTLHSVGRSQSLSPPPISESEENGVLSISSRNISETPVASPDSTDTQSIQDEEKLSKPHRMIKKKSGELVKPSLKLVRHRSLPSSPSKMVHFDSNLVSVRSFFRGERPTAVNSADAVPKKNRDGVEFHLNDSDSTDGSTETDVDESPSDTDLDGIHHDVPEKNPWIIKPANFTQGYGIVSQYEKRKVFLDRIYLSADRQSLIGHIYVRNICYTKNVSVRYTVNYWRTFTEVAAEFNKDATSPTYPIKPFNPLDGDEHPATPVSLYDRFTFVINLQDLPSKVSSGQNMCFCTRFEADGQVFWGNNDNKNYEISLQKQSSKVGGLFDRKESPRSARVKTKRRGSRKGNKGDDQFERYHRRAKTEYSVPVDYEFDKDFSDDRGGDSDLADFYSMLNLNGRKKLGREVNQKQTKSDESSKGISAGQKKNKKKLLRRYNFGSSWNDMLGRNNSSQNNGGEVSESDNEGGLKLVFPRQDANQHGGKDDSGDDSKSLLSRTADPGIRPAWDSLSYKDLIHKYCFFGETPNEKEKKTDEKLSAKLDVSEDSHPDGKENVSPVPESVKV